MKNHRGLENKVIEIFEHIKENPFQNSKQFDIKAMKGIKNYYRLRIGNYRVIFETINEKLIIYVIKIDNRGDIYKNL